MNHIPPTVLQGKKSFSIKPHYTYCLSNNAFSQPKDVYIYNVEAFLRYAFNFVLFFLVKGVFNTVMKSLVPFKTSYKLYMRTDFFLLLSLDLINSLTWKFDIFMVPLLTLLGVFSTVLSYREAEYSTRSIGREAPRYPSQSPRL